jgi:S-DNA-T family DNA segregation ATPase FtsK/SpoIIIE
MTFQPPNFWRAPRLLYPLPQREIELYAPPQKPSPPGSLWAILVPAGLTVTVMVAVLLLSKNTSMLLLSVPMLLVSSVSSFFAYSSQKRAYRKKLVAREQKYRAYLASCRQELEELRQKQCQILLRRDPWPLECLTFVLERERTLWARAPEHQDFLQVRLGLGELPSSIVIKTPKQQDPFDPDPLIQEAQDLAKEYAGLPDVPICVDLRQDGPLGLAGPSAAVWSTARAIAVQLATHHAPDELKIMAFFSPDEEEEWSWLRWMPHVWSEDRKRRFLACGREMAHELLVYLNALLNERQSRLRDAQLGKPVSFPYYIVVFVGDLELILSEPILQRLRSEGTMVGICSVWFAERTKVLPPGCMTLVRVGQDRPFVSFLARQSAYFFYPDEVPLQLATRFAQAIAPIRLRKPASPADIPSTLSLLELLHVRVVEDLDILGNWRQSQKVTRSLAVPIGVCAGGEVLKLDLHERVHGPNGLVAGMVGTGKSELLQTLVASLAVHFHPHKLAFVLIDYKGGGMADPFSGLPHILGTINNLQERGLAIRAVTALNVECERRLRLFAEAGVNHIDDYQQLYYEGRLKEPLPYLVVVVDEFAELKTEQPEVAKEFIRIARIGRALGFRLILAMQKPAGIVDGQIEANTRFRLCLRVAQVEDSQAMLRRPEAAHLSGVGRAYFQVGVNEVFELFQVAWSGAPYEPSALDADDPLDIVEIALDGSRRKLFPSREPGGNKERISQLKALMAYLKSVAKTEGIAPLRGLWLPPLPDKVALQQLPRSGGWNGTGWDTSEKWLNPVVGLLDDPKNQNQRPLALPLREGHLAIYGAPGYGKTTLVQTLVMSLALSYSPAEVNLYLLDFGGRLLRQFEGLPHVGAVITADEGERVERLLRYLLQELERRKEAFGRRGVSTLLEYRTVAKEDLPAIVVVIDNYAAFTEAFEEVEDSLTQLAREGGNLGLHLVLTANTSSAIRYKISSNITLAVALYLTEPGEYPGIVGRTEGLSPAAIPGRGLVRGTPAMEFQVALPAEGNTDSERNQALREIVKCLTEAWHGRPVARPILTCPSSVALCELLPTDTEPIRTPEKADGGLVVPLGLEVNELQPFEVSLSSGSHYLIAGPPQSGKTTLLQSWLLALAQRYHLDCLRLYLIDSKRLGLNPLAGLPHVGGYAGDVGQVNAILAEVEEQIKARQRAFEASMRGEANEQGRRPESWRWPALVLALEDLLDPSDDLTSSEAKERLTALLRQGRRFGLYLLVSGSAYDLATKGYQEPAKMLRESQVGFMLGGADDSVFSSLRVPLKERGKTLPLGQAYFTFRGHSRRVQLASAHVGSLRLAGWVEMLAKRYAVAQR